MSILMKQMGMVKWKKKKGISSRINLIKGCFNTKEQVSKKRNPE